MTKAEFRAKVKRVLRDLNPKVNLKVTFDFVSEPCPYKIGEGFFRSANGKIEGDGFRTAHWVASVDMKTGELSIR